MSTRPMTEERLEEIRMSYAGFPADAIPIIEEKLDLLDEVDRLKEEVDRVRELNSRLTRSLGTLEQGIADAPDTDWREHLQSAIQRARSFGPPETTCEVPATVERLRAATDRQRDLAEAARPAESTAAASDCEELVPMTDEHLEKIRGIFSNEAAWEHPYGDELLREVDRLRALVPKRSDRVEALQDCTVLTQPAPVLWLFRAGRGPVYASRQKPEPQVLTGVLAWTVDGEICPVSLPLRDWIEPGQRMALVALPIGGDA